MSVKFSPNGLLDVATDPQDLPSSLQGKVEVSGAMTRCTNLHLDRMGVASTRRGSSKVSATDIGTSIHTLLIQAGARYAFVDAAIYRDEVEIESSLTNASWSGILYNAFNDTTQAVFALNGTDRKRIEGSDVYEWGVDPPEDAPTAEEYEWCYTSDWEKTSHLADDVARKFTVTTDEDYECIQEWEEDYSISDFAEYAAFLWWWEVYGDYLTSKYQAKITYCRKVDDVLEYESNPSPVLETRIVNGVRLSWTDPTDTSITHIRIYRTFADEASFYYDQEVAIGTQEAFFFYRNEELGAELETTHDRPPLGTLAWGPNFDGVCFIAKDNLLYHSLARRPEYWPALNYVEVGPPQYPIVAGAFLSGQLYLATAIDIYQITGTGAASFFPIPMGAATGTQSRQCFLAVKGQGIFHLGTDGIYQFTSGGDAKVTDIRFEPIFRGETAGSMPGLNRGYIENCWMIARANKLYFGYPGGALQYPKDVIVTDLNTGRSVHYQYSTQFRTVAFDTENNRILAADVDGYIWQIEDADDTDDNGTAISWQIETKEFGGLRKYFPRYARYDVSGTATASILLDGVSKQSHALLSDRSTRKRLITGCTGDRLSMRISGSGGVDIYSAEVE